MRSLRLPLGLLLSLGLAAQVCLAAGLWEEEGGKAPRLFPVQSPQAADFKAESLRLRDELLGKRTASKRMILRFNAPLDHPENRLNQLSAQPSWTERSIDPGIVRWADPSIDSGIVSWADPSIDPGIVFQQPGLPEELRMPMAAPAIAVPALK